MPRFALLHHDHPFPHWDLLLEDGPTLRTWRLHARPPGVGPIVAELLPAHRLVYLDYEGPVPGGRGMVMREMGGEFTWVQDAPEVVVLRVLHAGAWCEWRIVKDPRDVPLWRFESRVSDPPA